MNLQYSWSKKDIKKDQKIFSSGNASREPVTFGMVFQSNVRIRVCFSFQAGLLLWSCDAGAPDGPDNLRVAVGSPFNVGTKKDCQQKSWNKKTPKTQNLIQIFKLFKVFVEFHHWNTEILQL